MIARVIQEERRARTAVDDVRNRERAAERGAVALLKIVGLLARASVERIRRRVEHRAAEVVVRVALNAAAAAAQTAERARATRAAAWSTTRPAAAAAAARAETLIAS